MKLAIGLVLALILSILTVSATQADAPPIAIDDAFAYRHVLGDVEDTLIVVKYYLIADGTDGSPDPPLFTPADWDDLWDADNDSAVKPDADDRYLIPVDAVLRVENFTGGLLSAIHPPRFSQGVAAFYFEEGTLPFTWNDAVNLVLVGNPSTVGASGTESDSQVLDWRDTASQIVTAEELADSLLSLINTLEQEHIDYDPGDLLSAGLINIDGRELLLEAFPIMDAVAPTAFTLSSQIIPVDNFDPGSDQLQSQIDAATSTRITDALDNFADVFEISADFLGIILAFILAAPLGLVVAKISNRGSYGLFAFTGILVWATASAIMPVIFLLIVAGIFFVAGGIWLATKIPFG